MRIDSKTTMIVLLVSFFIGSFLMLWRKYSDLKYENGILINNEYAYQQDILSLRDSANYERGVYRMTIDQVKNSNDTLVQELEKVRKQLKIKDKYVSQMSISKTTVSIDTVIKLVRDTVLKDSCDFRLDITYNDQTKATVGRIKDSIYHSVDIQSSFHSFISTTVQYREKKFLKRLFCFKWKKDVIVKSTLNADNNLVKIKDYKVLIIEK